jgi:hypothetical protein
MAKNQAAANRLIKALRKKNKAKKNKAKKNKAKKKLG